MSNYEQSRPGCASTLFLLLGIPMVQAIIGLVLIVGFISIYMVGHITSRYAPTVQLSFKNVVLGRGQLDDETLRNILIIQEQYYNDPRMADKLRDIIQNDQTEGQDDKNKLLHAVSLLESCAKSSISFYQCTVHPRSPNNDELNLSDYQQAYGDQFRTDTNVKK